MFTRFASDFFYRSNVFLTVLFLCGSPSKILVLFAVCIMPSHYFVV